mgnify:CR=1 FL=1
MRISIICLATCLLAATSVDAQNFEWAKSFGGALFDDGNAITIDASGNVYTTGFFEGTVDFDPGPGIANLSAVGRGDIFIQKMDASGNFLWAKAFGGTLVDIGYAITTDASGNVYTVGRFQETVDFDPGAGTFNLSAVGGTGVFVQKLDPAGNFLWVKSFGGPSFDMAYSIAIDGSGNIYTTGRFQGTADFDPGVGTVNLNAIGNDDIFIHKMDASGNFLWARTFGSTSDDYGNAITVDATGNVYTTGYFRYTIDFDPGTGTADLTTASPAFTDIFIQKLDPSGNFLWARALGGAFHDEGHSIQIDNSGNVYTAGFFRDTVDFDPGAGEVKLTAAGEMDVFVQKMDSAGNFLWAKSFGGTSSEMAFSMALDASGNVYSTGWFSGTADFDPGAASASLTATGGLDIFIQKMDAAGNFLWASAFGGTANDQGISITVDSADNVYTTGKFQETVDFDPGTGIANLSTVSGSIYQDVFVHKMSQGGTTGLVDMAKGIQINTFPNPSDGLVQLRFEQALHNVQITLTDLQGKVIFTKHFDRVFNEPININGKPGLYFLRVETPQGRSVVKLIKE